LTEIAFHFNADDRLNYLCRLLRKAVAGGAKLVVTGPVNVLAQLDMALWTFSASDFIAHCGIDASQPIREKSPVVLTCAVDSALTTRVLVNLNESVPDGFEVFQRLIEIVTYDESDKKAARARWKFYADAGCQMVRHDLQKALV
jgi:DNA polymerase-3 subunit chi